MCEIREGQFKRAMMLVDRYLEYLEITKNYSKYTVRNYRACLMAFICVLKGKAPETVNLSDIHFFRLKLKGKGLGFNSIQLHLIVVRQFLKFCVKNDIQVISPDKIEICKYVRSPVPFLDRSEVTSLLRVSGVRDSAIIALLYSTGCRVSELASLNRIDIVADSMRVFGKGRKWRCVFVSEAARKYVDEYLKTRTDTCPCLFLGKKGRLGAAMIEVIVRTAAKKAGIHKKVTPHTLRHTFATELLRNGAPLPAIQQMLGHSSITTTQVYTHITDPYLREIHGLHHR